MKDPEYIVREVPLPPGVHGIVREDPDGLANIYINAADPEEEKMKTLEHELLHVRLDHLHTSLPCYLQEMEVSP